MESKVIPTKSEKSGIGWLGNQQEHRLNKEKISLVGTEVKSHPDKTRENRD